MTDLPPEVLEALGRDLTIDIVTRGARTGQMRTTEIWFTRVDGRIIICGTPAADGATGQYARRDWLANLKAHPRFWFCLKESIEFAIAAEAVVVTDPADRRAIMSAPGTQWYRQQVPDFDFLVRKAPIVEVFFGDRLEVAIA